MKSKFHKFNEKSVPDNQISSEKISFFYLFLHTQSHTVTSAMSIFALALVVAVVLLGLVLPTATTATAGEKQYVSFDANNVILDPARPTQRYA